MGNDRKLNKITDKEANGPEPRARFWKRMTGQSLVEFALAAPILIMVIFGIIDMARIIQAQVTVSNASREAVRFAITGQQEQDGGGNWITRTVSITNKAVYAMNGLPLVASAHPGQFGFYTVEINPSDGGAPDEIVEITTWYSVQLYTPFVNMIVPSITLHGFERAINEEWGAVQALTTRICRHCHIHCLPGPPGLPIPRRSLRRLR